MRKVIASGIGLLIILLALAGTGSAKSAYSTAGAECGFCHVNIVNGDYTLTSDGSYFRDVHKFNGISVPTNASSCLTCHSDLTSFLPLTSVGSNYSKTHRYNATTLAAKMLPDSGCANCHMNAIGNNFNLLTGTPTYLTSTTCLACHKAKYDNWSNTLHAVMLTPADKAQAMNIPEPEVGWAGISYVIVTKFEFAYINTTGYFLATNDAYETENKTFADSSHAGGKYGTCGRCHTTGWNASATNIELPGFSGTLEEPGIACERCHGAGGNGHQVVVNYSGDQCRECHTGVNHGTGWENGAHAPPPYRVGSSCMFCHSSFDQYKNQNVTEEAAMGVSCGVCHNIHDMTDAKYAVTFSGGTFNATTWSQVADSKLAFFNATASIEAGTDVFDDLSSISLLYPGNDSSRKDASYGTEPINVTGKPDSVKLCSICHYRHGLAHMTGGINLSHANGEATCIDCHMEGANAKVGKGMMKNHDNKIDSGKSCGGTKCHGTSTTTDPLVANGSESIQKRFDEWEASLHNDKEVGGFAGPFNTTTGTGKSRANSCNVCHDPMNWNPAEDSDYTAVPITEENFKGITCSICHPLHDMGNWFEETFAIYGQEKAIGLYEKVQVGTRYKGTYRIVENSTELCGSCHSNDHPRLKEVGSYAQPGWPDNATNPNSPHGWPAAEFFVGSWKQTGLLKFECKSCHYATLTRDANGTSLPQDQRVRGHSFQVNTTLLQLNTTCSGCHITGTYLGNISTTIQNIKDEYNITYNAADPKVTGALANVKNYGGEKNMSRELIAQAYWNLRLARSDSSLGVHNPAKAKQLLDEAIVLADAANASLGNDTLTNGSVHNINKGTNYTTIQAAINDASPGDEIHVDSGTYYENVNVNKQLTLRGINMPVVDANGSGSAITLFANGIILEGFTATESGDYPEAGIKVTSNDNTLTGSNALNNYYGIFLDISSNNNTIYHNNIINNTNQSFDFGTNSWDSGYPSGGNYWSDYTGTDSNNDGIGETPYSIPGGSSMDSYPFMQMNGWIAGDVTYVDCTRSGPGSGTFIDPYPSIQDGINSAIGTLVKVASGTCIENVDLKNGIFLLGAGADITTIEGNVMAWNVDNTRISNFTITDNDTAGIHSYNSTLTITNNIIRDQPHNGIHSFNSSLTIFNNVLSGNGHNGILLINQSSAFIRNNIIVHNGQFGVGSDGTPSAVIDYNDVWNNTLGGSGLSGGTHDLNMDPQFISSSDFRLQPASPAINAGDPNSNYNDADGSRNDMGAFGGHIITKSEAYSAQFAINKNFVVGTDLDSLSKGIYNRDLNYNLDINNFDDTSDTVMGNIRFDAKADNITNVDWREYAIWNKTSANWTYPTDRLIYENEGFGTGFNTNYSESRILNVSIYRWMNNTNFSTNGYQLVMFNATFENTNFEWAWARIEANNRNEVNVSIIENTFTKDAPGNYNTWENGIQFDFDKNSIQPGKVYNFSVVVKVDLTEREAPPIQFKPQFSIGMGTYYNSTVSQGFKAEIPAGMLPDKISYASASSNVNNAWLLKRHDHNIAQLEEVSRIAYMTVTNPSANQSDIPDDTDNVPLWGETARLNITVTDASIIANVTVNLSEIGGSAAKSMTSIGENVYSTTTNASAGILPKVYNLTVNATDTFGNSNTSVRIELRVRKNGDTNGNNAVNIGDALRLANNVSYPGNPAYALSSIYVADVTGDGKINIGDALRLANNVSYPGNPAYILK